MIIDARRRVSDARNYLHTDRVEIESGADTEVEHTIAGEVSDPDVNQVPRGAVASMRLLELLRELLTDPRVDRDRIWIGGEGHGGMLALDLLLENPGLFRGALLLRPAVHRRQRVV